MRTRQLSQFTGRSTHRRAVVGALLVGGMLVVSACGSSEGDDASDAAPGAASSTDGGGSSTEDSAAADDGDVSQSDEVASLDDTSTDDATADGETTLAADEAALELSECLREQGLDVPDIGVDADGNVEVRDAFENIDRADDSFQEAFQACADLLEGVQFGGGRGGLEDNTALEDAFVAVTDCVREQGFEDAEELNFGQPGDGGQGGGQGGGQFGGEDGPQGGGQFGRGEAVGDADRNERLATQMGLDPEDPAVITAMEVCGPILEDAFSDFGAGQGGGGEG